MLIRVLFCIIRFYINEHPVVLFPGGPRPHPVTRAVNGYGLSQLQS